MRRQALVTSQPMTTPTAIPPRPTTTNDTPAATIEKAPVTATAIATRYAMRADASLIRLSPSRIVTTRDGTPSRRKTAVAATASGGATIAPSVNAGAPASSGMSHETTTPTTTVVNSTSPIASRPIGRALALRSRIGVE